MRTVSRESRPNSTLKYDLIGFYQTTKRPRSARLLTLNHRYTQNPLKTCNGLLETVDRLHREGQSLQSADWTVARSQNFHAEAGAEVPRS
jgi:hypothetical protein